METGNQLKRYQPDQTADIMQSKATNGSSTQRENLAPGSGLQLTPKHEGVLVQR